jgi:hypothetical protein
MLEEARSATATAGDSDGVKALFVSKADYLRRLKLHSRCRAH